MDQDATQRNDTNQGFFSKIVFRLKGFLNTAPVSLKIGIFAGFLLFSIIKGMILDQSFGSTTGLITLLMLLNIPFLMSHNRYMNEKYNISLKEIANPFVIFISGILLVAPGIFGNIIPGKIFDYLWLKAPLIIAIPSYGICVAAGFLLTRFFTVRKLKKIEIPSIEYDMTALVLCLFSGWIGVVTAWVLILGILLLFGGFAMMLLSATSGGGGSRSSDRQYEEYTEYYNEAGDKVGDSRNGDYFDV